MSTASNSSWKINRSQRASEKRGRANSSARALNATVPPEEAYSYALRVAYLHYLLQPKKMRKEWIAPPKKIYKSSVNEQVGQLSTGNAVKLPHSFRGNLERRI